jgi:hypothetical protein
VTVSDGGLFYLFNLGVELMTVEQRDKDSAEYLDL